MKRIDMQNKKTRRTRKIKFQWGPMIFFQANLGGYIALGSQINDIQKESAKIPSMRIPAADPPVPDNEPEEYTEAELRDLIKAFSGKNTPIKQEIQHPDRFTHITQDMAKFYLAVGTMQLWECYRTENPVACANYITHLKDPLGHIGFVFFMLTSGVTSPAAFKFLSGVDKGISKLGVPGKIVSKRITNPLIGMVSSHIGLAAGMMAQDIFMEIWTDPLAEEYRKSFYMRNTKERIKKMGSLIGALWKKTIADGAWRLDKVPDVLGLLSAAFLSGTSIKIGKFLAKETTNFTGTKIADLTGRLMLSNTTSGLVVRNVAKSKSYKFISMGFKLAWKAGRLTMLHPIGKLGIYVVETMIFLGFAEWTGPLIGFKWDRMRQKNRLVEAQAKFFEAMDAFHLKFKPKDKPLVNAWSERRNAETTQYLSHYYETAPNNGGVDIEDLVEAKKRGMILDLIYGKMASPSPVSPEEDLRITQLKQRYYALVRSIDQLRVTWDSFRAVYLADSKNTQSAYIADLAMITDRTAGIGEYYNWIDAGMDETHPLWTENKTVWHKKHWSPYKLSLETSEYIESMFCGPVAKDAVKDRITLYDMPHPLHLGRVNPKILNYRVVNHTRYCLSHVKMREGKNVSEEEDPCGLISISKKGHGEQIRIIREDITQTCTENPQYCRSAYLHELESTRRRGLTNNDSYKETILSGLSDWRKNWLDVCRRKEVIEHSYQVEIGESAAEVLAISNGIRKRIISKYSKLIRLDLLRAVVGGRDVYSYTVTDEETEEDKRIIAARTESFVGTFIGFFRSVDFGMYNPIENAEFWKTAPARKIIRNRAPVLLAQGMIPSMEQEMKFWGDLHDLHGSKLLEYDRSRRVLKSKIKLSKGYLDYLWEFNPLKNFEFDETDPGLGNTPADWLGMLTEFDSFDPK